MTRWESPLDPNLLQVEVRIVCLAPSKYSDHPAAQCRFTVRREITQEAQLAMEKHWREEHTPTPEHGN